MSISVFTTPTKGLSTYIALTEDTAQEGVWYIKWADEEKEKEQKKYLVGLGVNYYIKNSNNEYELIDRGGGSLYLDGTAFADVRKPQTKDTVYVALTTIVTDDYELEHFDFNVCFEPVTLASGGGSSEFVEGSLEGSLANNTCTKYKFADGITALTLKRETTTSYLFNKNTVIQEVTIPTTCKTIDANYFYGCTALTSITDCSGVTSVGDAAFQNCTALQEVSFSTTNDVTIGLNAFLVNNTIPSQLQSVQGKIKTIKDYAFKGCANLKYIDVTSLTLVGKDIFSGCVSLYSNNEESDILKLSAMRSIGSSMFSGCTSLKNVEAENSTSVGEKAFYECTALQTVNVKNVTTINANAFYGCTSLQTINMENVITIGEKAFYGCTNLYSDDKESDTLHLNQIEAISSASAFENCTKLKNVEMSKCETITEKTFQNCSSLETVVSAAYSVADRVFYGCTSLKKTVLHKVVDVHSRKDSSKRASLDIFAVLVDNTGKCTRYYIEHSDSNFIIWADDITSDGESATNRAIGTFTAVGDTKTDTSVTPNVKFTCILLGDELRSFEMSKVT